MIRREVRSVEDQPRPLFEGGRLRCPHDGQLRNLLAYRAFEIVEEFADELNVVFKCPCGHVFSPGMNNQEREIYHRALQESVAA